MICDTVETNETLSVLNLSKNHITDFAAEKIGDMLRLNDSL